MRTRFGAWLASALLFAFSPVHSQQTSTCGWEDGSSTILGSFGNLGAAENVTTMAHSGSRSLRLLESPESGTPQAYLAFLEGLSDGDVIDACFWAYDISPNSPPSIRIWAHYASGGDIDSNRGSAGGNTTYSGTGAHDGGGWSQICHQWVFDSLGGFRDALVIEARLYSPSGRETEFFIDDLEVTVSSAQSEVGLACGRSSEARVESSWGNIKVLYR